jgi:hypothetical protein
MRKILIKKSPLLLLLAFLYTSHTEVLAMKRRREQPGADGEESSVDGEPKRRKRRIDSTEEDDSTTYLPETLEPPAGGYEPRPTLGVGAGSPAVFGLAPEEIEGDQYIQKMQSGAMRKLGSWRHHRPPGYFERLKPQIFPLTPPRQPKKYTLADLGVHLEQPLPPRPLKELTDIDAIRLKNIALLTEVLDLRGYDLAERILDTHQFLEDHFHNIPGLREAFFGKTCTAGPGCRNKNRSIQGEMHSLLHAWNNNPKMRNSLELLAFDNARMGKKNLKVSEIDPSLLQFPNLRVLSGVIPLRSKYEANHCNFPRLKVVKLTVDKIHLGSLNGPLIKKLITENQTTRQVCFVLNRDVSFRRVNKNVEVIVLDRCEFRDHPFTKEEIIKQAHLNRSSLPNLRELWFRSSETAFESINLNFLKLDGPIE